MAEQVMQTEKPVLLIGLGGTGKQILLQLRHMFQDRYGTPSLPHIGQLCIDTDVRNVDLEGRAFDEFLEEVQLTPAERVDTPIKIDELKEMYRNANSNRHIFRWFDRQLEGHGIITDGAAQIRSFGRLAFFQYYPRIKEAIENKLSEMFNPANINRLRDDYKINLDVSQLEVWLLFSVAGGTGSGMFLDMAYLIDECAAAYRPSRQAVVLLPTAFSEDFGKRLFANSYAALMELEYYNNPGTGDGRRHPGFLRAWTTAQAASRENVGPPPVFRDTWLIGNRSTLGGGAYVPSQKIFLCEMIAEWLFLQYGGVRPEIAAAMRSARSNYSDALTARAQVSVPQDSPEAISPKQVYSRRYSTFGLSKIFIATRLLAAEARHRLSADIVSDWLTSGVMDAKYTDRVYRELEIPLMLANSGTRLIRELAMETADTSIDEVLDTQIGAKDQEFRARAPENNVADAIRDWFENVFIPQQLEGGSPDPNRWGAFARLIRQTNAPRMEERISTALDAFLAKELNTRGIRFDYALMALRFLSQKFSDIAKQCEAYEERAKTNAARAAGDTASILALLDHGKDDFTRKTIIKVAFEFIKERAKHIRKRLAAEAARKVAERMVDVIGRGARAKNSRGEEIVVNTGLLRAVEDLRSDLIKLRDRLTQRGATLRDVPASPANKRVSAPGESAVDGFYRTSAGEPFKADDVAVVSNRILEGGRILGQTSVWGLRDKLGGEGANRALADFVKAVRDDLAHIDEGRFDVLSALDASFSANAQDAAYRAEIEHAYQKGSPMLETSVRQPLVDEQEPRPVSQSWVARTTETSADGLQRLDKALSAAVKIPPAIVSGPKDTIYFMSERSGIPLFGIPRLDDYADGAYADFTSPRTDATSRVVHNELDVEKYPDLLPYSDEERERREAAWRVFAQTVALGIMLPRSDPGKPVEWHYVSRRGLDDVQQFLGSTAVAVRLLAADGSVHMRMLRSQVDFEMAKIDTVEGFAKVAAVANRNKKSQVISSDEWEAANAAWVGEITASIAEAENKAINLSKTIDDWAPRSGTDGDLYQIPRG